MPKHHLNLQLLQARNILYILQDTCFKVGGGEEARKSTLWTKC